MNAPGHVRAWIALACALSVPVASFLPATRATAPIGPRRGGADFEVTLLSSIGRPPDQPKFPFTAVTADMDRDGDLDLLVNWHHHGPIELFENEDGVFRHLNAPGADTSGLYENRGVPYLYESEDAQAERIRGRGDPGLYVWHDPDRTGFWRPPKRGKVRASAPRRAPIGTEGSPTLAPRRSWGVLGRKLMNSPG